MREDVVQEVTFVTAVDINPVTGELGEPDWSTVDTQEFPKVTAPPHEGWMPDSATVPAATVKATDEDMVEHVVYHPESPTGTPDENYSANNNQQTGRSKLTLVNTGSAVGLGALLALSLAAFGSVLLGARRRKER